MSGNLCLQDTMTPSPTKQRITSAPTDSPRIGVTRGAENSGDTLTGKKMKTDLNVSFRDNKTAGVTPRQHQQGSTSNRPNLYLLGHARPSLTFAKLPKTRAVLERFLDILGWPSLCPKSGPAAGLAVARAAEETTAEMKTVWLHHFGPRLIEGKESWDEEKGDVTKTMTMNDKEIEGKIVGLFKQYKALEQDSRRPDRAARVTFKSKEVTFVTMLDNPFNIAKMDAEETIRKSGIVDHVEEVTHLRNQLSPAQIGCAGSWDDRQKKRDNRKIKEREAADKREKESKLQKEEFIERSKTERTEHVTEEVLDDSSADPIFEVPKNTGRKKIDIMGKISVTADGINLSISQRTKIAASVVNAMNGNIDDTNISRTSAWRRSKEVRAKKAEEIKDDFDCPDLVTVHWDGKMLKLRGNIKSNRVCVYLSGADGTQTRKLLGVPETPDGTGKAESEVVTTMLVDWKVKKNNVVGMVFDTTSSNTGVDKGACRFCTVQGNISYLLLGKG
jgi:hypothetical protein